MNMILKWVLVFTIFVIGGFTFDVVHKHAYKWCTGKCNHCKNWQCKYFFDTRE